jgi:hypothetical protein
MLARHHHILIGVPETQCAKSVHIWSRANNRQSPDEAFNAAACCQTWVAAQPGILCWLPPFCDRWIQFPIRCVIFIPAIHQYLHILRNSLVCSIAYSASRRALMWKVVEGKENIELYVWGEGGIEEK